MADMVSQLEGLKAQMRLLEEKKECAELEVVILQNKCKKMSVEIEHLKDECADVYEDASRVKRARKGKEKESEVTAAEIKRLKDMMEAQKRTIEKILDEKRQSEANTRMLEQRLEISREKLSETNYHADNGWAAAKRYHDLLVMANRSEERLKKMVEELIPEKEWWESEAQRHQYEKDEWVKGWQAEAEYQEQMKNTWIGKYEDLVDNVQYHAQQWTKHFDEADAELRVDPWLRLPPRVVKFMKYCQGFAKSFRKRKVKLLM